MSRATAWLLAASMLAPLACAPRAGRRDTTEEEARNPAKYLANVKAYYAGIPEATDEMLPRIREHARALANLGPRQTGQEGCDKALAYIRESLEDIRRKLPDSAAKWTVAELPDPASVTVALDRTGPGQLDKIAQGEREFTHVVVAGLGPQPQRWPAHAMAPNCIQACATHPPDRHPPQERHGKGPYCPNCEQPRRVVDLGIGSWAKFKGNDLDGAVVLLDFNSGDAWLRAASVGAAGALFVEPQHTTVFQADKKYSATLPLHFPRLYLRGNRGLALRKALADGGELRVTLASRLELTRVPARALELTIPGKDRSYCFVLAGHFDARCIVPDLAYGGAEVWGIAELIELTRYLAANQPSCDIRILFVSGHWQSQRVVRDYIAEGGSHFERIGRYYKLAMGIDLVPEGKSLNLLTEGAWDVQSRGMYRWLGNRLFTDGGWRDRMFDGLGLPREHVELYGGARPFLSETGDGAMANRMDRSAFVFAPRYPTAEQPFQALALPTFAFQTSRLTRLTHNTPLDGLAPIDAKSVDEQLGPQLKMTLAMLRHLQDYPRKRMSDHGPSRRRGRGWGGYARIRGRILQWDRSIGWFAERLPGQPKHEPGTPAGRPAGHGTLRTFLHAYPTDSRTTGLQGPRLRNYLNWPQNPAREQHRELQAFMFQDLRLLEESNFTVKTVYAGYPETQYDVVAYSLDDLGRIRWATDYGVHGDGNKAFQCTDVDLVGEETYVPVSLFECGTLELFGLMDPQRYNPATYVFGAFYHHYGHQHADGGMAPHLLITAIKDVDSHTDIERWGFTQYGPTAMIFLPADHIAGAEILLGAWHTNFAVLNDPDESGVGQGYRLSSGQTRRLTGRDEPTSLACVRQLTSLNQRRMEEFAAHDVASPLAKRYHADSAEAVAAGQAASEEGDPGSALAHYTRAWSFESEAYRNTLKLLLDVVATTVLYFVLLIPFSFLVERLMFPQRTALRTALVSVAVFAVFAAILYLFHPGFKLAHNVVVTVTAFVIVVMTIPALILLLVRGVAMLRAIGSKAVITQRSEAESAGVVIAALSLAVSNMRRRRLRTALTLVTITSLVVALVLLTTSSAFDFKLLEPSGTGLASFEGLQVYNATDRRHPLLTEMVEVYETALADEALVIRREGVNYGYNPDLKANGAVFLRANGKAVAMPYLQVMDHRDDLVEYTYPFVESVEEPGKAGPVSVHRTVSIHLSDLFKPVFEGEGDFNERPRFDGRGEFFSKDDVEVCLLPNTMAEELGVKVGETVSVMGLPLKVKGIWTAITDKEEATGETDAVYDKLTGLPALPMVAVYLAALVVTAAGGGRLLRQPAGLRRSAARVVLFVVVGIALLLAHPGFETVQIITKLEKVDAVPVPGPIDRLTDLDGLPITCMRGAMFSQGEADNPLHAPSTELVIVPRAWLHKYSVFPSVVHSLVVIPKGQADRPEKIREMAERLATEILNVDVFSRYLDPKQKDEKGNPRMVAIRTSMHTATHVKGSSMMIVVLAVAVLMVLAIMTGTVYERVREIHIFSSVGLSPRHVAGMFLIEALVYAGIAAVLGYFIGIISLKGLLWYLKTTGSVTEFYPNYLGVFVIYSIGIAVLATVASSLYPIRLASKIVNPAEGRGWQSGASGDDDHWHIRLPFIATTWDEARAMMVYAHDYLVIHQGERSGRFVCQSPPRGTGSADTVRLEMPVWLAPFERNLTQDADLAAAPAPDANWWIMTLNLTRISGPPYLWKRGATVFVDMICKHLLRWRAATDQQETDCLARSDDIFPPRP